ncbi:maleylpyruvate isomerase family mycothiol-dependent enzyme [Arthrobacter sp. D2-10]
MVARHDLTTDAGLKESLLTARRGTAFFGRKLKELTNAELYEPSLMPGWTRAHVAAHIGYNARAIARLIDWANTGNETPMYESPEAREHEIDFGATLPPDALRHLYEHSAVHLNVEWRDTPDRSWKNTVRTAQGREVPASETVWLRTREVWVHAVDLDNGAGFADIPIGVLERMLRDITAVWRTRDADTGLVLKVSGSPSITEIGDTAAVNPKIVSGALPELVAWAAGRPAHGLVFTGGEHPAPRWI